MDDTTADVPYFLARDLGVHKFKEVLGDAYDFIAPTPRDDLQGLHKLYASELPFYDVEDGEATSAIPNIFGIEKPERDKPFGFVTQTHSSFCFQLTRCF